jgi:hypothetical protein
MRLCVDRLDEVGGRHQRGLGCVAGLEGISGGGNLVCVEHVGADGPEQNIEGQLRQTTLVPGTENGVCLATVSLCSLGVIEGPYLARSRHAQRRNHGIRPLAAARRQHALDEVDHLCAVKDIELGRLLGEDARKGKLFDCTTAVRGRVQRDVRRLYETTPFLSIAVFRVAGLGLDRENSF